MTHLIKSLSFDQDELIESITNLYCGGRFDVDATYGNGGFYKTADVGEPDLKFDIDPQNKNVVRADSRQLPLSANSVDSVMFDPPFLTYVKAGREHNNGSMIMASRFGGYWRYDELKEHYISSFAEFARVLRIGGVMVVKCQDIIHNHALHPTHIFVNSWAEDLGFKLKDLYVLAAKHRMGQPQKDNKQKHARIYHSYFLVFVLKEKNESAALARAGAAITSLTKALSCLNDNLKD